MIWLRFILTIFKWLLLMPLHLLVWLSRYIFAVPAVLLFSTKDRKHLRFPFRWLETQDNDLGGDFGWQSEHIKPGSDPYSNYNRIMWLFRNGGQVVEYKVLGIDYKEFQGVSPLNPNHGLSVRTDGYWQYRNIIGPVEVYWGWGLWSNIADRSKYVWTTRRAKNA